MVERLPSVRVVQSGESLVTGEQYALVDRTVHDALTLHQMPYVGLIVILLVILTVP